MLRRIYNKLFGKKVFEIEKYPSYIEYENQTYFLYGDWSKLFPIIGKTICMTYVDHKGDRILVGMEYNGNISREGMQYYDNNWHNIQRKGPIYWRYINCICGCKCQNKGTKPELTPELKRVLLQEMEYTGAFTKK